MADNKNDLIKQADDSLYMAKNTGRNMIQVYRDVLIKAKEFSNIYDEEVVNNMKFLLSTISAKDKYTLGHSERVADYLLIIADALGISKDIEKYH